MADSESIYHPGRHTTIFSDLVVLTVEQKGNISCENYCEYDVSWKLVENRDPRLNDKIHLLVNHRTRYPFDVKVKLIAKLHRAHKDADPETRIFPLSMEPGKEAIIELEELNQMDHSHLKSCELISFQLEVFEFDYVSTIFATEPNLEDSSRTHDIVVTVNDRKFYLMASYITAWSDWFSEQVYQRNMSEICLEDDVNPDIFKILLTAIHPNINMKFFEEQMCSVLILARRYRMSRLVDLCTNRLKDLSLYPECHVLTRLKIANECRDTKLKSICLDAFGKSIVRDNWVQENQITIRKLPAALNLKLIMMVVKNREEIPMDEEDNEEGDDEIVIIENEFSLTDQSQKHNKILVMEGKRFFVDTVVSLMGTQENLVKHYLSTWSGYFDQIYYGSFGEDKKKDELVLMHGTKITFDIMLHIMYKKQAELITDVNVLELMDLAFYYQVHTIVGMCGKHLMNLENLPDLHILIRLQLADTYRHLDLLNFCLEIIRTSYNKQQIARECVMKFSAATQRNLYMAIASY